MSGGGICSKHYYRGHCKREVVFWVHAFGRRHNACRVHLGDVMDELDLRRNVAKVLVRSYHEHSKTASTLPSSLASAFGRA